MNKPLTSKQFSILKAIDEMTVNYPPTIRELADEFGTGTPKVMLDHLRAIEKKGYIRREKKLSRGLFLTEKGISILGKKKITQIDPSKYMPAKLFERKDKVNVRSKKRVK